MINHVDVYSTDTAYFIQPLFFHKIKGLRSIDWMMGLDLGVPLQYNPFVQLHYNNKIKELKWSLIREVLEDSILKGKFFCESFRTKGQILQIICTNTERNHRRSLCA